ncbi:MAG: DUF362 domain-containing protein [Candidatus Bathyarchaeia archaeon]
MSILHQRFGQTTIAKVRSSDELRQMLVDPWLESETIVIKPNWVTDEPAIFTDSKALRMILEVLDSHIVVVESLHIGRCVNLLKEGMSFTVGDKKVNWRWLLKGEGWNWLIENHGWDWFRKGGHWDQLKKEDKAFLDEQGFTDLFKEFNVSYINVTDEVWNGRVADPSEVRKSVESRFKPVQINELYGMVPKKLYDLRGSTFISFAKLKMYASFTIKNLFGMIPDPLRPWWHGPKNSRIATSIVDINKIYHSLFNVYGICEALNTMAVSNTEGKFEEMLMGKYNIIEDLGIVAFGRDLVSLDAILCNLAGFDLRAFAAHIIMAEEEFGAYDRKLLKESRTKVVNWLLP